MVAIILSFFMHIALSVCSYVLKSLYVPDRVDTFSIKLFLSKMHDTPCHLGTMMAQFQLPPRPCCHFLQQFPAKFRPIMSFFDQNVIWDVLVFM